MNNIFRFIQLQKMFKKTRVDWRKSKSPLARECQELELWMKTITEINPDDLKGEPHGIPLSEENKLVYADNLARENAA